MAAKKITRINHDSSSVASEVEEVMKKVQKTSLDISFNELLDMKETGELNISPDFQRLFKWSDETQSRFIESLILEMPVPPIYMIEEQDGSYLLIDGLQRISSYLHLRGFLDAPHLHPPVKIGKKLVLQGCDILESLNGKTFDDLSTAIQIRLKRNFIRAEVIRKGSDAQFKYHMFKRLNSAGIKLTEQQIRNATVRLLDPTFNDFIIELSHTTDFLECISILGQQQKISGYPEELILRFFALKNWYDKFSHDVSDFLTEYMEGVSNPDIRSKDKIVFDYNTEKQVFLLTFSLLANTLGEKAFGLVNKKNNIIKGFSVYHYEAFTMGIQDILTKINVKNTEEVEKIKKVLMEVKANKEFNDIITGGGKNSKGPLAARIGFVKNALAGLYE